MRVLCNVMEMKWLGKFTRVIMVGPTFPLLSLEGQLNFKTMSRHKRQRIREDDDDETEFSHSVRTDSEASQSYEAEDRDTGDENLCNTDDEIPRAQATKRRATAKRKRRATGPSQFGATLLSLLKTETSSTLPLSLKPSAAHQRNDAKLELKAKKRMQIERKEKEDKGRIRDVIEGWGAEGERSLRKVAQRGGGHAYPFSTELDEQTFDEQS